MQTPTTPQSPEIASHGLAAFDLETFVDRCAAAARAEHAQDRVAAVLREALQADPARLAAALSGYWNVARLEDLVVYRSETLTLLHGIIPPGFTAAPHNHNLWSVIAVYEGQEDNTFFERDGDRLVETGRTSVVAPGILCNAVDAIHSIHNPLPTGLRAIHAYGGDLLGTSRSNWDPETHEEQQYDWRNVARS